MKTLSQILSPPTDRFYYYDGKKIYLKTVLNQMVLTFKNALTGERQQQLLNALNADKQFIDFEKTFPKEATNSKFLIVQLNNKEQAPDALAAPIAVDQPDVAAVSEVFEDVDSGVIMALTNQLFVKLKENSPLSELEPSFPKYGIVTAEDFENGLYLLTLQDQNGLDALDVANQLHRSGLCEFADPNFVRLAKHVQYNPNDAYYSDEWHIPVIGANSAWCWSKGVNIVIGIMDIGINNSHPDLAGNHAGSYDPTGQPLGVDSHGTCCAGIADAIANNSIGVAGVSFQSTYQQIRIGYNNTGDPNNDSFLSQDSWVIGGFNYAKNNGVSVVSCSFNLGSHTSSTDSAIQSFATAGRSNKGGVICAATGNNGNTSIGYPASNSYVIAVGASDETDDRASFSNYGTKLAFIAPGVYIPTTDYTGSYNLTFSGTSAATPIAAACAALILSNNPALTGVQVLAALATYTDKVGANPYIGGYTYGSANQYCGYGRINVYKYFLSLYNITGPNNFCGASQQYAFSNLPAGTTVTWSSSNANLPVSATGVVSNPSGNAGETILTATLSNGCTVVTKYVVAGAYGNETFGIYQDLVNPLNWTWEPGNSNTYTLNVNNNSASYGLPAAILFGYAPNINKSTQYSPPPVMTPDISDSGWLPNGTDIISVQVISTPPGWYNVGPSGPYLYFSTHAAAGTLVVKLQVTCGYINVTFKIVGH
jgi:subtilisin family serine protease